MPQFAIIIRDEDEVEYYKRIVAVAEDKDFNFIITKLDQSLNVKPRRKRADAGKSRTEAPAA